MMGSKNKKQREEVWNDILSADFDLGLKVWKQYVDKHPQSMNHRLSSKLISEMATKWEQQSEEERNKLYSNLDEGGNWKKIPDIREQSKAQAVDYLRRVQGFDVVLGKPLKNWSQDR